MPIGTIAAIVAVIILVIAVPLGTMLFLHKRGGAWTTFLIGGDRGGDPRKHLALWPLRRSGGGPV